MLRRFLLSFCLILLASSLEATQLPDLTPALVNNKVQEIMSAHATYKSLNPMLIKRVLINYIEELDPTKTYLIKSDIAAWLNPSDIIVNKILRDYQRGRFDEFDTIYNVMVGAIQRHRILVKKIDLQSLPKHVGAAEFRHMEWAQNEHELLTRLERIKALQLEAAAKLDDDLKEKSLQRIAKRQTKYEDDLLVKDPSQRQKQILLYVLKATASALDTHTVYFTPEEAAEFMIAVQQRLYGIGVQLRDDLNGFTAVKIISGGPAALGKQLKVNDRIIAINGEPVVGVDITDAVKLIRGEEGTTVTLTVVREVGEGDKKKEEQLDIVVQRGEVILKESRYEASYQPFGSGVIAYLHLYSFYQDENSSSASDLEKALTDIRKDHSVLGVILDLRSNSGGLLTQAVDVAGLFISKGVVVSIKDNKGHIEHLRNLNDTPIWKGPLILLVNRGSASASEIVAQTLQDYGRALIVGDDHTFGKGTFQTFTLNISTDSSVNPEGEYKVTRGLYYTVSGKTPQLKGVISDIVVPGALSQSEIGEQSSKYPLENDRIPPSFQDDLSDIPFTQRLRMKMIYSYDLQPRLMTYQPYVSILQQNSTTRLSKDENYINFEKELNKINTVGDETSEEEPFGQNDLQLDETYNIMKDLIQLKDQST